MRGREVKVNRDYTVQPVDFEVLVDASCGYNQWDRFWCWIRGKPLPLKEITITLPISCGCGQMFKVTKTDPSPNPVVIKPPEGGTHLLARKSDHQIAVDFSTGKTTSAWEFVE